MFHSLAILGDVAVNIFVTLLSLYCVTLALSEGQLHLIAFQRGRVCALSSGAATY